MSNDIRNGLDDVPVASVVTKKYRVGSVIVTVCVFIILMKCFLTVKSSAGS